MADKKKLNSKFKIANMLVKMEKEIEKSWISYFWVF